MLRNTLLAFIDNNIDYKTWRYFIGAHQDNVDYKTWRDLIEDDGKMIRFLLNTCQAGLIMFKLEEIIKVVTPTLHKNGLVVIQIIDTDEIRNIPSVKTILAHTDSGESIESVTPVAEVKLGSMNTYQSLGSGITYMRRYSIAGILGICPDDDIDSNEKLVREVVSNDTKK